MLYAHIMSTPKAATRRPTNVTLRADLLNEARQLGINVSEACESGLRETVAAAKRQRWLDENQEAIEDYNRYVEQHGLILEKYRQF